MDFVIVTGALVVHGLRAHGSVVVNTSLPGSFFLILFGVSSQPIVCPRALTVPTTAMQLLAVVCKGY